MVSLLQIHYQATTIHHVTILGTRCVAEVVSLCPSPGQLTHDLVLTTEPAVSQSAGAMLMPRIESADHGSHCSEISDFRFPIFARPSKEYQSHRFRIQQLSESDFPRGIRGMQGSPTWWDCGAAWLAAYFVCPECNIIRLLQNLGSEWTGHASNKVWLSLKIGDYVHSHTFWTSVRVTENGSISIEICRRCRNLPCRLLSDLSCSVRTELASRPISLSRLFPVNDIFDLLICHVYCT